MRSLTFVSTSRSDFAVINSILELSNLENIIKINLLICKDIGFIQKRKNLNIFKLNSSTEVGKLNKQNLENELSNNLLMLAREFPDTIIFLVGDRWETLYVAYECLILDLPVIHHSGGDITNGAIDNQIRDAITALSDFHLTSHELHSQRLLKLGESFKKVLTVGEPSLIKLRMELEKKQEFNNVNNIEKPFILACFHSSTLENISYEKQALKIIDILKQIELDVVITYPNMDPGGVLIHEKIKTYSQNNSQILYLEKLGNNYFNYLVHCYCIIGNSSSGIIEAPLATKISINIGNRQNGRLRSNSVIDISYSEKEFKSYFCKIRKEYKNLSKDDFKSPYLNEECIKLIEEFVLSICSLKTIKKIKIKSF